MAASVMDLIAMQSWQLFQEERLKVNCQENQDSSIVGRQARDREVWVRVPVQVQIFFLKFNKSLIWTYISQEPQPLLSLQTKNTATISSYPNSSWCCGALFRPVSYRTRNRCVLDSDSAYALQLKYVKQKTFNFLALYQGSDIDYINK